MDGTKLLEIIKERKFNKFSDLNGVNPSDIDIGISSENCYWLWVSAPNNKGGLLISMGKECKYDFWHGKISNVDLQGPVVQRIIKDLKLLSDEEMQIMFNCFGKHI